MPTPTRAVKVNPNTGALIVPNAATFTTANGIALLSDLTSFFDFKGAIACAGNPNYPAALKGDVYAVSSAGKIGGASGIVVEIGDTILATADNAGGTQASVGASWVVNQNNIDQSNVAITGGTIDGTVIGGTTAAAGTFTTVNGATIATGGGTLDLDGNTLHIARDFTAGCEVLIDCADDSDTLTVFVPLGGASVAMPTSGALLSDATDVTVAQGGTGASNAADARTNLGLVIGTNVQAYDSDLTTWAGVTPGTGVTTALAVAVGSAGAFVTFNGAGGTPSSLTLTNATALPVSGITASTSTALGVGSVELGHATDTTISRVSAGKIAVEGVAVSLITDIYSEKIAVLRDDFAGGTNTDGQIGEMGWRTGNIGGTGGSGAYVDAGGGAHPGQYAITTATAYVASVSDVRALYLAGSLVTAFSTGDAQELRFTFKLSTVSAVKIKIGMTNDQSIYASNRGEYIGFDTALGETNFMGVTKDGGAETRTSTGVAVATGWFTAKIRYISSSSIGFSISSAGGAYSSEITVAQTAGGAARYVIAFVGNNEAAAKTLTLDLFTYYLPTTAR